MRAMVMRRPRTDGPVAAQQSGNLTTDLAAALPTPTLAAELCPSAWHSDSEYHPSGRRDAADGVPPHRIDGGATGEMGRPGPQQCEMAVGGQLWLAYLCMYVRMVTKAEWN